MDFLKNKAVILTGASQGLGQVLARELIKEGARLAVCALDSEGLELLSKEAGAQGSECLTQSFDVRDSGKIKEFVQKTLERYGTVDALINNAGWAAPKQPLEEMSESDYRRYIETNLDSAFYFMKYTIPALKQAGSGMILNIASGAGVRGHGGLAGYSASKFGMRGLVQSAAWELEPYGVTTASICPGGIDTDMRRKIFGEGDSSKQQSPHEVAGLILKILKGEVEVPSGADVFIRNGEITEIVDCLHS